MSFSCGTIFFRILSTIVRLHLDVNTISCIDYAIIKISRHCINAVYTLNALFNLQYLRTCIYKIKLKEYELIKEWNWSRDGTDQGMELIKGWNYQEEKLINERNWLRDGTNQRVKLIKGWNWSRDKTDQGEELIKGWKGSRDESDQGM